MRILKTIVSFIAMFGDDIFALIGLAIICRATFMLNYIAGWYVIGLIFLLLAVVFSKNVPKPPRKG
ncbi:hypothetical protein [Caenibacillus caldisaponilyticus]|uniref:hypothetical protein n=1 Tax=Caenibacillus caldisaponilyticus TaxID=1674942 RepID=UPI000988932E|nr:hypothetical protein [Caenibacillus caldisaponilyticus]